MDVIASFDHSIQLEMAINSIEEMGVPHNDIFAVPLEKRNEQAFFDTMHHSDGKAMFDGIALSGGFFCALGTIYGFVLAWGPVIWGLIGFVGGSLFGGIIKLITLKAYKGSLKRKATTEVFLVIHCKDEMSETVEEILWRYNALGVATALPQS